MQRTTSLREAVTGLGAAKGQHGAGIGAHADQRVVRRLDPLEVRHVAATIRVVLSGEATESGADLLGSRALLEAEHEVRVVRGADLGELPRVSELVVVEEATVDHVPRHRHMLARKSSLRAAPLASERCNGGVFRGVTAD
mgnify:CR=1 FL=1